MLYSIFILAVFLNFGQTESIDKNDLIGAWKTTAADGSEGLLIVTEAHFSITYYKPAPPEFIFTGGGKWEMDEQRNASIFWEYHTKKKDLIGKKEAVSPNLQNDELSFGEEKWMRVDAGKPGKLSGAWLITGRKQNGEVNTMTPGARKTMKILSGTKFQWIAYNSETSEFFGTGGGTYTTKDGKYIENIEFFSRDNSRVGASLEFDFELEKGKWHHSGKSSKGDPIYEIWSTRQEVGI